MEREGRSFGRIESIAAVLYARTDEDVFEEEKMNRQCDTLCL